MSIMDRSLDEDCPPAPIPEGAEVRELPIVNRRGLHARASAKFVQTVERFDADVTVTRCGETVGGRSIMGLLTLGAAQGTSITVTAKGTDATACLQAIDDLLANKFGEGE
jgi:phosphocarrier protein HPr